MGLFQDWLDQITQGGKNIKSQCKSRCEIRYGKAPTDLRLIECHRWCESQLPRQSMPPGVCVNCFDPPNNPMNDLKFFDSVFVGQNVPNHLPFAEDSPYYNPNWLHNLGLYMLQYGIPYEETTGNMFDNGLEASNATTSLKKDKITGTGAYSPGNIKLRTFLDKYQSLILIIVVLIILWFLKKR